MIDIQQVKNDFENGVIISRATWGKVIEAALQPAQQAHALTDAASEVTPMFLLNVALCIENYNSVATRSKDEILAKLHRISDAMQAERMARLKQKGQ